MLPAFPTCDPAPSNPLVSPSYSDSDSVLLNVLDLLLCQGRLSTGVLGREDPDDARREEGWRVPWAGADVGATAGFLRRESERVAVLPVVLLLHRRSLPSVGRRRSSMSGVGVVLRDELLECDMESEDSLPRRLLGLLLRSLNELVADSWW